METPKKGPPLGRPSDRFFDLLELFLGQLVKLLQTRPLPDEKTVSGRINRR